jgi:hypothetical protein
MRCCGAIAGIAGFKNISVITANFGARECTKLQKPDKAPRRYPNKSFPYEDLYRLVDDAAFPAEAECNAVS